MLKIKLELQDLDYELFSLICINTFKLNESVFAMEFKIGIDIKIRNNFIIVKVW